MGAAPLFSSKAVRGSRRQRDFERILANENLAPLDFNDGAGGITTGNRGSGKLLDAGRAFARTTASAVRDQRHAILAEHRFRRGERRVYALYADGLSTRAVADRTGLGRMAVFRMVARIEREWRARPPETRLGELLADCEPATIVLFFALLERALVAPREVREMVGQARAVPEIRALLEPDDMREPAGVPDRAASTDATYSQAGGVHGRHAPVRGDG
jgi:hypothetical protein